MRKTSAAGQGWLSLSLETVIYNYFADQNYTQNYTLPPADGGVLGNETNETSFPLPTVNCIPASIEEFPDDFLHDGQRLRGGFLLHAAIVAYVCAMLAIVCDRYFVPSLSVICKYFDVPADIAGATFMAVGTSSPELFSSVIGAFVAKGDIGVGTVVGSAVFNLLGVTGASGLVLGTLSVHLEWYPITRDCLVYVITVSSLVLVIHDNVVTWLEASCLLMMFGGYLLILYFNPYLKCTSSQLLKKIRSQSKKPYWKNWRNEKTNSLDEGTALVLSNSYKHQRFYHSYDDSACPSSETSSVLTNSTGSDTLANERFSNSNKLEKKLSTVIIIPHATKSAESSDTEDDISGEFEEDQDEVFSLHVLPDGIINKIIWIVMWPANLILCFTIPNCNSTKNLKWFPLTFISSIMWLGILSYISFWMVAIIGYTFGIPDTVSGLTILAAGTSVPELVASIIVVKKGMANMAISNLIGSNIFDILFCLGLPWLVKALMNTEIHSVVINSSALTYTTLILLSVVVLFYISLVGFRFKYGWRVGVVALCLYAIFLVLASLYESNVFGDYNPPICSSNVRST